MKRTKTGYTLKQFAYAQRRLAPGRAKSKKALALAVGYAPSVADSVSDKIEKTEGYSNAVVALASEAGNIALKLMHELKHRDLSKMDFVVAVDQLQKIADVFDKFTAPQRESAKQKEGGEGAQNLRAIFLTHVESKTVPTHRIIDAETKTNSAEDCGY